jgi:hypothetical protein
MGLLRFVPVLQELVVTVVGSDGTFARYRLSSGVTLPVYRALNVQPYFMREVNYEGSFNTRDVFGLVLITAF